MTNIVGLGPVGHGVCAYHGCCEWATHSVRPALPAGTVDYRRDRVRACLEHRTTADLDQGAPVTRLTGLVSLLRGEGLSWYCGCGASVTLTDRRDSYQLLVRATTGDDDHLDFAGTLREAWRAAEAMLHTHRSRYCRRLTAVAS